jgi:PTH1 family peptidyl-tRNA hydrolase
MKLVVGLGNPGSEYVGSRHNVGWEALDVLADRLGWITLGNFERLAKNKFQGLAFDGQLDLASGGVERLLLLKPLTYVNLSGQSVQAAMAFYQVTPADVIVVLDDLALPTGKIRLRSEGSSGGHNGLKDIERALGTTKYPRLRIGIDPKPQFVPQRDYVLGRFTKEQRALLDPVLPKAAAAIVTWADKGIATAMNQFNVAEKVTDER